MKTNAKAAKGIFYSLFFYIFCCGMQSSAQDKTPYGDNKEKGSYITLNGVKHYYEVYGSGHPLLLIHGNKTGIPGWAQQIEYFSKKYKVYAIDCRGRGKSELGKDSLTYIQQAKDMAAFMETLKLDSVWLVGKSDGAIVALLAGIYYPQHIGKIVAFAANMSPDTTALYGPTVMEIRKERLQAEQMLLAGDRTQDWYLVQQRNRMMEFQPHITAQELGRIRVPVLVMSCDRDVIKEEHTFFIYKSIPLSHLCFLPGENHHVAKQNAALFNLMTDKFLSEPYKSASSRFE